ncbi:MAG: hypothetical protein K2W95_21620 [Candidatus Obscuribacterales bacterium]|nr:hypothetical protein [Candidatus Obscuribacterales bacterium]
MLTGESDFHIFERTASVLRYAEKGNARAQLRVAKMLWHGDGLAPDRDAAQQWLNRAALDGLTDAQLMLGDIWRLGLNGVSSERIAAFWYARAAEAHSPEGLYRLALCFRHDSTSSNINGRRWLAIMQQSAECGYRRAMLTLADHYLAGNVFARNWAMALHWYLQAAETGELSSLFLIAQIFRKGGYGVSVDMNKALHYFREAARAGLWPARVELARTLLHLDVHSEEAIEWLDDILTGATRADVVSAVKKIRSGELHIAPWTEPVPPLRESTPATPADGDSVVLSGVDEILMLCHIGDAGAQYERAEILWHEGRHEESIEWLERAAHGGFAEAQYRMAMVYKNGYPLCHDRELLAYWCHLAAEQGHRRARSLRAQLFDCATDETADTEVEVWVCRAAGLSAQLEKPFHADEIIDSEPRGTLYRRVLSGGDLLVVIRLTVASDGKHSRVFWLRVPSEIVSVQTALSWALGQLNDNLV